MLDIHGNTLGILMFVMCGVIAGIGGLVFKLPEGLVGIALGLTLIVMDGVIRFRARTEKGWLTAKQHGGSLFFIPAWGAGLVVIVANIINTLQPF
jgi:hypothetical protein